MKTINGDEKKMDQGNISTILITLGVIILGVFVADPTLLQNLLGPEMYARYGVLISAILLAVYNYCKPRSNPEPVEADSA